MELTTEKIGDVTVVVLPGDQLDASNAKEFKRDVTPLLEPNGKVIFDLTGLRFVDSSGLGAFLSSHEALERYRRGLEVVWDDQASALALRARPHAQDLRHLRHERRSHPLLHGIEAGGARLLFSHRCPAPRSLSFPSGRTVPD